MDFSLQSEAVGGGLIPQDVIDALPDNQKLITVSTQIDQTRYFTIEGVDARIADLQQQILDLQDQRTSAITALGLKI